MSLYSEQFYSKVINELFSDTNCIYTLLKVEAALAQAQADEGIIPQSTSKIIQSCCNLEFVDINKLKNEVNLGGNIAIPLVQQLTKAVKNIEFEASKYVHLGATSQDIIDTATVVQIDQFINWLKLQLNNLITELQKLTFAHKNTVMVGRTLLQQAKPITFGLKTSTWLESLGRSMIRVNELEQRVLVVQLAGAVGSQNQNITPKVVENFAHILGLKSSYSWQSQRDNFSELACDLAILSGTMGKIAKDISLLMQTEIAEVYEGANDGKGGSSTMPHKRNPVTCAAILANSARIPQLASTMLSTMIQEHERSAGGWHAEWEVLIDIIKLTAGSVERTIDLIGNIEVDKQRMLHNIELTNGLIFAENISLALAPKIGKIQAHELVEKYCKIALSKKMKLKEVLIENKIDLENIDQLFDPENAIGNSIAIVDSILKKQ